MVVSFRINVLSLEIGKYCTTGCFRNQGGRNKKKCGIVIHTLCFSTLTFLRQIEPPLVDRVVVGYLFGGKGAGVDSNGM